MNPLPVSARGLRRSISLPDQVIAGALLPCFDCSGKVQRLLVVGQTPGGAWLTSWEPGLVYAPMFKPIQFRLPLAALQPMTSDQVGDLDDLWYFDPTHVASGAVSDPEWASQGFESANAAERFTRNVRAVYFRRDLSRVSFVAVTDKNGLETVRFKSDLLPDRPKMLVNAPPRPRASRTAWQLDPIWKR